LWQVWERREIFCGILLQKSERQDYFEDLHVDSREIRIKMYLKDVRRGGLRTDSEWINVAEDRDK